MKHVLFIIWMLATLVLVASVIGMVLFIPTTAFDDDSRSTWMKIGYELSKACVENE